MQKILESPFLSLCGAAAHNIPALKAPCALCMACLSARFSRHKRLHRILYVKRSFCHPKEQKPPAAEGGNRYDGWNMQVVCQQTRSTCLQFIDCSRFSQILNTFFAVQWTQNPKCYSCFIVFSYCNINSSIFSRNKSTQKVIQIQFLRQIFTVSKNL